MCSKYGTCLRLQTCMENVIFKMIMIMIIIIIIIMRKQVNFSLSDTGMSQYWSCTVNIVWCIQYLSRTCDTYVLLEHASVIHQAGTILGGGGSFIFEGSWGMSPLKSPFLGIEFFRLRRVTILSPNFQSQR